MQTVAVTSSDHLSARKFVYDDNFVVDYDIVVAFLHNEVGFQSVVDIVLKPLIFVVGKIFDIEVFFGFFHAVFVEEYRLLLFSYFVIVFFESLYESVGGDIHIARLLSSAAYDKRGTSLVHEYAVHFVNDCVFESALHFVCLILDHIVAQIVKSEFVVGRVHNVAIVRFDLFFSGHMRIVDAYGKSQKLEYFTHPLCVTLCKIFVDGNDMHAFFVERLQICGKSRNKRLTFTCTHLGNSSLIEDHAAHELNVEVSHSQHSVACLSYRSKRFGKQSFEAFALFASLHKSLRASFKFIVAHSLVSIFESYYFVDRLINSFEFPVVVRRKNLAQNTHFLTSLSQIC